MQKGAHFACLAIAACVAARAPAFADAASGPGKEAAYSSLSGVALTSSTGAVPAAGVQILKGKKKRVLEVDVTGIVPASVAGQAMGVIARLNGLSVFEPNSGNFQVEHGCVPGTNCTVQGRFWVDLDAAEAAYPGLIIGQPLNVEIQQAVITNTTGILSVRARMRKK